MNKKFNPTKEWFENNRLLSDWADRFIEYNNGERVPEACIARALRYMLDPESNIVIRHDTDEILAANIYGMLFKMLVHGLTADNIIMMNCCLPPLSNKEKQGVRDFIDAIKNSSDWEEIKNYYSDDKKG